ncbi:hypothetical protein, partial [Sinorhizobium meliloti]|uniref:hypothetical protein n=1 Tax=Rhizobium meliloti TaxID=382 RepID=UPI0030B6A232
SGKADAGGATRDHGGLSVQSGHFVYPSFRYLWSLAVREVFPRTSTWPLPSQPDSEQSRASVVRKRSIPIIERHNLRENWGSVC